MPTARVPPSLYPRICEGDEMIIRGDIHDVQRARYAKSLRNAALPRYERHVYSCSRSTERAFDGSSLSHYRIVPGTGRRERALPVFPAAVRAAAAERARRVPEAVGRRSAKSRADWRNRRRREVYDVCAFSLHPCVL